jgi:hypothetical protein
MKPQLGNSNSQIQGFMNNGQAVSMSISAWINEPKEIKGDPAAIAAIQQIHDIMLQHRLVVSLSVSAKQGDDAKQWPKIGSITLFPNPKAQQEQQPQANQWQQQQQPPAQKAPWQK